MRRHQRKPEAKAHDFYKLFCRASPVVDGPEKLLVVAILWKAVGDALTKATEDRAHHREAKAFFAAGDYRPFCELIDLDPDWVAKVLRDYAAIECGASWGRAA